MKNWTIFALVLGLLLAFSPAQAQDANNPDMVVIPGTLQSELGCSSDWQPDCQQTALVYDPEDDVWQGTLLITPGNDQDKKGSRYKAALNGSWSVNYGLHAAPGGADIPLLVTEPTEVKFYYDHKTHWVTDDVNSIIAVAIGDFQQALGCQNNTDPTCLRSWLQDPDGDGLYTFTTRQLSAGTYSAGVALYEEAQQIAVQPVEFTVKKDADEIYFGFDATLGKLLVSTEGAPRGDITKLRAHWVSRETILWDIPGSPGYRYRLYYAPQGGMTLSASGIDGVAGELALTFQAAGPKAELLARFPHLRGLTALTLAPADLSQVPTLLKGQVIVTAWDAQGKLIGASGLQIPGALDDLYHYDGSLGVRWENSLPTLRVWAPTAQRVRLLRFPDSISPAAETLPMDYDPASGVWSLTGTADWQNQFYLYEVQVYVPATGRVEINQATDPYSLSLSTNGKRSQIVNLDDPALKPPGWDALTKPLLEAPEDIVLYELHVRDFSAADPSVPAELRGTFKAFTLADSNGMRHLKRLAQAGLTHIHLLPAFDIASVNEDKSTWKTVDEAALRALPGDSDQQQAAVSAIAGEDAFNWGYDPLHYTAPEGSYATDPDGEARVLEFREMVQALNQSGLRVVMDVVYNHTNASGQSANSVLDKIVPGYYHRLNADGLVEHSTCCENTASEHWMMEKLITDSVLTWAEAYKVDGFRFDLMGHHLLSNMTDLRAALDALTPAETGIDGRQVYLYGEGWDFGEVAQNARGKNASQLNIGGTGIGVFNDRLRDAARGGGPFGALPEQGFITGLWLEPNQYEARSAKDQRAKLDEYGDWIRIGLAGNLAEYTLTNAKGYQVPGRLIGYNGAPAGYTRDPQENIVYISAHDNETLWDVLQAKAPAAWTVAERVRMYNLGLNIVMLSQGVPFFHAGDELLRSKSLDRNSYNSGDWFNRLDYTYQTNNWAVGLPPSGDNADKWDLIRPLLADPQLQASPADIQAALGNFETFLKIRKSSQLFRLRTAAQVQARLSFVETGAEQTPGLLAYWLNNDGADQLADPYQQILVVFNASPEWQNLTLEAARDLNFALHPALQSGSDDLVKQAAFERGAGLFQVPPRTTAVFVLDNPNWQSPASEESAPAQPSNPSASQPEKGSNNLPGLIIGGLALLLAALGAWQLSLKRKRQ